jgi:hypothetical protein
MRMPEVVMSRTDATNTFARAVAEAVILLDAGLIPRSDDGTLRDLLALVGADEALPERLLHALAVVVGELMLRPTDGSQSGAVAATQLH